MMTAVGKKFPDLSTDAMDEKGSTFKINVLQEAIKNKKKVLLFWYPKDFTFVCPTELHAFQVALGEFEKRETIVIGASCDTPEVHFAWLSTQKNEGGIKGVTYPILADSNRNLSNILGILDITKETLDEETQTIQLEGDNVTYRATYLIDEQGVVFHEGINHMPIGRSVNEYLRLIDAYTYMQENGEVCPANWEKGQDAMKPSLADTATYLASH